MNKKTTYKKCLSIILTLVLAFTAIPLTGIVSLAADDIKVSGDYEYVIRSQSYKTCEITKYKGSEAWLSIPSELDGYKVIEIDSYAFENCYSIIFVTIPDSVTTIDTSAFGNCISLEGINIPDSVTSMWGFTFAGCSSLKSITIPNGVTSIPINTFQGCSALTSVTIHDGVTDIGGWAFEDCSSLTNVHIPDGVTSIEAYTFSDCSALTDIIIPDSVISIDSGAFSGCSSLKNINIPNGVPFIADYAFKNCSSLTNINIPNSVTKIGESTFYGCSSLESVIIPDSVTFIGEDAFARCPSLTIYGYADSYAEIYANNNSINFKAIEKQFVPQMQPYKDQIRFQKNDDGTYADKFDYRTLAKISKEDFIGTFGSEKEALNRIQEIGFVYAPAPKVTKFDMDAAKQLVADGTHADGYLKVPVNYISTMFSGADGQNADYVISCIVTNVPDEAAKNGEGLFSMAYIKYAAADGSTKYEFYETSKASVFMTLYNQNFNNAFPNN